MQEALPPFVLAQILRILTSSFLEAKRGRKREKKRRKKKRKEKEKKKRKRNPAASVLQCYSEGAHPFATVFLSMILFDFLCLTTMLFQHALNTPNKIHLLCQTLSPLQPVSIEKELRQEPDVRSAGTSSTQTRAPKEFCNTKHGCWMNLHVLRIRQLLKHGLSWRNYLPIRPIQVPEVSMRAEKHSLQCFQYVRKQQMDQSLRSQLASSSDRYYGNNAVVLHWIKSVQLNCS